MNNQPKFKKGDMKPVEMKIHTKEELEHESSRPRHIDTWNPDMLAIPDDHVWPETNNQK